MSASVEDSFAKLIASIENVDNVSVSKNTIGSLKGGARKKAVAAVLLDVLLETAAAIPVNSTYQS